MTTVSPSADSTCAEDGAGDDEQPTQEDEGEEDVDVESDDCEENEDHKPMSLGRATGLAKLPSVSEWLRCSAASGKRPSRMLHSIFHGPNRMRHAI